MSDAPLTASIPPPLPASTSPSLAKPVSKIRWAIHLAIMAAIPLVAAFGHSPSRAHASGPALSHTVHGLLVACGYQILFFAVPFALAWLASRANRDDLLLRWRPGYWVVPLGAAYSIAIRLAAGIVMATGFIIVMLTAHKSGADVQKFVAVNRPQVEKLVDVHAMTTSPAYFWLNVILVSFVIGGLREELWRSSFLAGLRALWPRAFSSTQGGIVAAAIAALFFGVAHLPQGPLAAGLITIVGFLLGAIMTLHRSVWPSVVAHGLFDAASLAALPFVMPYLQQLQHLQHAGG